MRCSRFNRLPNRQQQQAVDRQCRILPVLSDASDMSTVNAETAGMSGSRLYISMFLAVYGNLQLEGYSTN